MVSLLRFNYVEKLYIITDVDELSYTVPECVKILNLKDQKFISKDSPNYHFFASYITLLRTSFCRIFDEDKIINLDADTIIDDNIQPLWDLDLEDNYLAMAWEANVHKYFPDKTYPFKDTYNIGVNVMNLKKIREDNIDEKWRWLVNNIDLPCAEQDSAILLFQDKVKVINPLYNACTQTLTETELIRSPVIIHFAGDGSDCYKDSLDVNNKFMKVYMDYYKLYVEKYTGLKFVDSIPVLES